MVMTKNPKATEQRGSMGKSPRPADEHSRSEQDAGQQQAHMTGEPSRKSSERQQGMHGQGASRKDQQHR